MSRGILARIPAVRRRMIAAWAVAIAMGGGAFLLAAHAARALPQPAPLEELAYYPSGQALRPATLGHAESAADLAWIRAVQYYGEHRQTDNRFRHLDHVFDILTTLSPRFQSAYVFGAFSLAQEGRDFERAYRLLEKGIEANPRSGRLAFEMGFLHYVRPGGRDLPEAAAWFEQASRLPDGPPNASRFAAFARQHSGDLAVAYLLWKGVHDSSENPMLVEIARREMARIHEALVSGNREQAMKPLSTPTVVFR